MSAINCFGDEHIYGEVVPGWALVQLKHVLPQAPPYQVGSFVMQEGSWGLTFLNDPDFVFDYDPLPELPDDLADDDPQELAYWPMHEHYVERLVASAEVGYRLVSACIQAGYNPQVGGLASWLSDRMARLLKERHYQPERVYYHPSRPQLSIS